MKEWLNSKYVPKKERSKKNFRVWVGNDKIAECGKLIKRVSGPISNWRNPSQKTLWRPI
jgi:hypothetical protein